MNSSSSSSSSCSGKSFNGGSLNWAFPMGQKEKIRTLLLFLGLAISCLVLYKTAHPLQLIQIAASSGSSSSSASRPFLNQNLSDTTNATSSSSKSENSAGDLKKLLEAASGENKTVIITTLNQAWAEPGSLFDLFLESFRIGEGTHRLLNRVLVVCLDGTAFSRCSELHPHCYLLETSGTDFSGGEKVYMSPDYLTMMWRRIEFLTKVLEIGFSFIFTDADIMWFRDPVPRLYPDGDFQMACDRFFGDPNDSDNWVNGGFTYVKSNNRTIQFYRFWHESRLEYPGLHDQDVFNRIKHKPFVSQLGLQMRFFDTVYINGFCHPSQDFDSVCTMHANCCIGLDKKLYDLRHVLDDWKDYLSDSAAGVVKNRTWSAPKKCLE